MDATKKYFDQHFAAVNQHFSALHKKVNIAATKKDFKLVDGRINKLTDRVDKLVETVDRLAVAVANGFQSQQSHMDEKFQELREELDVRGQVNTLQKRIERLEAQHSYRRQ
jgi:chaperonin cofactor prefoldin